MPVTKETITPKKAMEYLKRNVHNRPLLKNGAQVLADAIKREEWVLNGETIKFNTNGDLIDGQHRLTAIVIAGKAIDSYVARQLPHEAFDTYDQSIPRRPAAVFARMGQSNYTHLAAAVKLASELQRGVADMNKMTNTQAAKYLDANPGIVKSVAKCSELGIRVIMSLGQSAALHYLMSLADKTKADSFWEAVASGEGLTKSMPAYQLRERLIENRAKKSEKLRRRTIIGLAIKAWNFHRNGLPVKCLKWNSEVEEFPTIQ